MVFDEDYVRYYDLFNKGKDYSIEVEFLGKVFERFGIGNQIKSILDLGCGTGLHAGKLISKGYEITGLDNSEQMIKIARTKVNGKFLVGDMANFKIDNEINENADEKNEKFDAIICMFSGLGYLTENKQIESFFTCCKNHLKEDGLLILDVWNGLGVMNELPSSREKTSEIGSLKIIRKSFPELDSKNHINNVRFNVQVFEDGILVKEYNENHKVRFFFPQEIIKYMEDVGFELIHICPSFEIDKELTENDWNMVVVGRLKKKYNNL